MMKKEKDTHIGLRIDKDTWEKFKYVADYEGRSCNGQLVYIIGQAIDKYEKAHGQIDMNKNK